MAKRAKAGAGQDAPALVIVESPAKANTINRYLGEDYLVLSSKGHIRDLPEGGHLGVDPERGWEPEYRVSKDRQGDVEALRKAARKASRVFLATDRDREGEAIAWHLSELLEGLGGDHLRVVFNEVTKGAILEAFEQPGRINDDLVNAQQARRFLDRVVGYKLSPLLWKKLARGLSAGRVQSVSLRLLVERERAIRAFEPQEYWSLHLPVARGAEPVLFDVASLGGKKLQMESRGQMQKHREALQKALPGLRMQPPKATERQLKPLPPLITSTLQREASARLGMGVQRTMRAAQNLYEQGHITYMRTDAVSVSKEALDSVRSFLKDHFAPEYLPGQPNRYSSAQRAQESHEAIRPTRIGSMEPLMAKLRGDDARIYELVWRRFVASQMQPARVRTLKVELRAGDYGLEARGRKLVFDGFVRVTPWMGGQEQALPGFDEGGDAKASAKTIADTPLQPGQIDARQHFTKPPPRYSEASLIQELEKAGIGRPSTYQSIIQTLQRRGYVDVARRAFHVLPMGEAVVGRLVACFPDLMEPSFTARMEDQLDEVAEGKRAWRDLLDAFYDGFKVSLEQATAPAEEGGMKDKPVTPTEIPCLDCGRQLQLRLNQSGLFLSCPGFRDKENPCKGVRSVAELVVSSEVDSGLEQDEEAASAQGGQEAPQARESGQPDGEKQQPPEGPEQRKCPVCASAMTPLHVDSAWRLYVCNLYPECPGVETLRGNDFQLGGDVPTIPCDRCEASMQLKRGRFGPYYDCTSGECDNRRKATPDGKPLPPRMKPIPMPELACAKVKDHFVLREGKAGLFLAASGYPKNRESRSPLVSELVPVAGQLPQKYAHLTGAAQQDPEGNPTVLRFDRREGAQYLGSLKDGKYTDWAARHVEGEWRQGTAPKPAGRAGGKRGAAKGGKATKATKTARTIKARGRRGGS